MLHVRTYHAPCCYCPRRFGSAAWQEVGAVEDPELQELGQILPMIVLRGRAPSTVKKYSGAFLRWKKWASQKYDGQA